MTNLELRAMTAFARHNKGEMARESHEVEFNGKKYVVLLFTLECYFTNMEGEPQLYRDEDTIALYQVRKNGLLVFLKEIPNNFKY